MNEEIKDKIKNKLVRKVPISDYEGERIFYFRITIWFDENVKVIKQSGEEIDLKPFEKITLFKDDQVSYHYEKKPNIYTSEINAYKFFYCQQKKWQIRRQNFNNVFTLFYLLPTPLNLYNSSKKTYKKWKLYKFLDKENLNFQINKVNGEQINNDKETEEISTQLEKDHIDNDKQENIELLNSDINKEKNNDKEIEDLNLSDNDKKLNYQKIENEDNATVSWKITNMWFNFKKSKSKIFWIKDEKETNKMKYYYIQYFDKTTTEPNELIKFGSGEFQYEDKKGNYQILDDFTQVEGNYWIN